MHIEHGGSKFNLELSLEEAFTLQAELAEMIRRHAMNVTSAVEKNAVTGVIEHICGISTSNELTFLNRLGRVQPGTLMLSVTRPLKA